MSIYQSYGDSVVTGASYGGYSLTSMAAQSNSLASSVNTGTSVSVGMQNTVANAQLGVSYDTSNGWTSFSENYALNTVYTPSAYGAPNYTCSGSGCEASPSDYSTWFTTLANSPIDGMWLTSILGSTTLGYLFATPTSFPFWASAPWPKSLASNYTNELIALSGAWDNFIQGCSNPSSSWNVPTTNRLETGVTWTTAPEARRGWPQCSRCPLSKKQTCRPPLIFICPAALVPNSTVPVRSATARTLARAPARTRTPMPRAQALPIIVGRVCKVWRRLASLI